MTSDPRENRPAAWGRRISDAFYLGVAWLFAAMAAVTCYEVAARYLFLQPTIWATETTTLLCAIAFLIAGAFVMRSDEHLSITILSDAAPPGLRRVLDVVRYVVILGFCLGLAIGCFWGGWEPLTRWERAGTQFNPPTPAIVKPLIIVVAAVMAIQATVTFLRKTRGATPASAASGRPPVD